MRLSGWDIRQSLPGESEDGNITHRIVTHSSSPRAQTVLKRIQINVLFFSSGANSFETYSDKRLVFFVCLLFGCMYFGLFLCLLCFAVL